MTVVLGVEEKESHGDAEYFPHFHDTVCSFTLVGKLLATVCVYVYVCERAREKKCS